MTNKISYQKKWDNTGCVYDQTITITEIELGNIQSVHLTEYFKNNEDKKNKIDYKYKLYLKSPNQCERTNNIVFTNHTQRDLFLKVLNIVSKRLLDRNTCFQVI